MNDLVTARGWNNELPAVHFRARARRGDRRRMANRAAGLVKQRFARRNVSGYRSSRRGFRRANEVREGSDTDPVVLGVGNRIIPGAVSYIPAIGRVLLRKQRSGDTHFVEVRVGGTLYQARMFTLTTA